MGILQVFSSWDQEIDLMLQKLRKSEKKVHDSAN